MSGLHASDGFDVPDATEDTPPSSDWRADTITSFPAIRDDDEPEPAPAAETVRECPCGSGKTLPDCDGRTLPATPGTDFLLSCAAGVVTRMSHERVRNGQWDDIPKCAREGSVRIHRPAVDGRARIQLDLEHDVMDLGAMFERDEALRWDQELDKDLRRKEAELAALLAKVGERGWHAIPEEIGRQAA